MLIAIVYRIYFPTLQEMKAAKGYGALREARNEKRLMGKRIKKAKEGAEAKK